jgi:DNA-binding transcriptional LysR family regulator
LRDGRADLVIGATNEPPAIAHLHWHELGVVEWVFAVSPRHPLAHAKEPLDRVTISQHRAVVVSDSARGIGGHSYGVSAYQAVLAVPSMRAKILTQRDGLGVGWLPSRRVASLIKRGELVARQTVDPREPNVLYVAWRGEREGRALKWWLERVRQPRLARRLVEGLEALKT